MTINPALPNKLRINGPSVADACIFSDELVEQSEREVVRKLNRIPFLNVDHITPQNVYHITQMEREYLKKGKFSFDSVEPNYYLGILRGWSFMLDCASSKAEITADLIRMLHDECVRGVITDDYPDGVPLGFRVLEDGGEAFHLEKDLTVSEIGVQELIERYKFLNYTDVDGDVIYPFKKAMFNPEKTINCSEYNIPVGINEPFNVLSKKLGEENIYMNSYFEPDDNGSASIDTATSSMIKLRPIRVETLEVFIERLIDKFNNSNQSLEDVIELVQSLDQLHPFVDGNIRTFGILLLNLLLLTRMPTPTICIMKDVNQFDCLSKAELVGLIYEGEEYFRNIM